MDWLKDLLQQVAAMIKPLDALSILVTFFITQRVKAVVPDKWRPLVAIVVGLLIAGAWGVNTGGWTQVPAYGFIYGAGAIALYMLNLDELIKKWLPGGEKLMGGKDNVE